MPDITMCTNKDCNKNNLCYRYLTKPDVYQSFSCFNPNDDCFIEIGVKEKLTRNKRNLQIMLDY